MLRFFPDAARVDQDEIGLIGFLRLGIMETLEEPEHPLRVVLIHLTTIGLDVDESLRQSQFLSLLCPKLYVATRSMCQNSKCQNSNAKSNPKFK
jgi:hypothetical protein